MVGRQFGDLKKLVDNYLPKSAIDKTTYKLGEIMKNRHFTSDAAAIEKKDVEITPNADVRLNSEEKNK